MQINELADDLRFVRQVVERQQTRRSGASRVVPLIWAGYVLIGYALIDAAPRAANGFFLFGGIAGAIASAWFGRRASVRSGVLDHGAARLILYRCLATVLILMLTAVGLASVIPGLRGMAGGQVIVAMVGVMYFQAGLWGPRHVRHLLWGRSDRRLGRDRGRLRPAPGVDNARHRHRRHHLISRAAYPDPPGRPFANGTGLNMTKASPSAAAAGLAPLDALDPLLQHRSRLGAMVLLSGVDGLNFTALRDTLKETDGNLGAQLRKLEDAGYLTVRKEFNNRKPISWYAIAEPGRLALRQHLKAIESLIRTATL